MRSLLAAFALAVSGISQGWVDVTPSTPGPETNTSTGTMCYDPIRSVTWLFTPNFGGNPPFTACSVASWDGLAWQTFGPIGLFGGPAASAWDPTTQRVAVCFRTATNGSGSLIFGEWDGSAWTLLPTIGGIATGPTALAFDASANRLIFVGEIGGQQNTTWTFDGTSWNQLHPVVYPSYVGPNGAMFFDVQSQRIALVSTNAYWQWSGSNWVQRFPGTYPTQDLGPVASSASHNVNLAMLFFGVGTPQALVVGSGSASQMYLSNYPANRAYHHLVYDSNRDRFVLHGGFGGAGYPYLDTWELQLGPNASYSTFGQGCFGTRGTPSLAPQGSPMPRVGNGFTLQVSNLPWTGPAFMFFGFSNTNYGSTALPFNLGTLGAPQCNLFVSGDVLNSITNVLGVSTWNFFVPNYPGLVFYNQAFAFDPVANPLGLTVSNAGHGVIGS